MCIQVLAICCLLNTAISQPGQNVMSLMSQPDNADGWQWDLEPEMYDPETLFEYINGEAEHYKDYSFVEMVTASHSRTDDEFASFTIDIYDMGSPLNAFGIYSSHRRPELTFDKIGEEAIVSELSVMFYKGRFFVQVSAGSMEEVVTSAIRKQAEQLASRIEATAPPAELTLLPVEGQIPHTLEFLASGLLAQAAFKNAMEASYNLPSGQCRAFIVLKEDEESALAALNKFRESLVRQGQFTEQSGAGDPSNLIADTQYYGTIMAMSYSTYVVGIVEYSDKNEAKALLENILVNLYR